ncbi:hypothetical protein F4212_01415 [Candidatus Poribacteria bacterium]|nr:hypothetical protein [Candidatus Poribacteria bacterium]
MNQLVHPKGHIQIGRYMTAVLRYVSAKMPEMVSNKDAPLYEDFGFTLPEFKHVKAYPVSGASFTGDIEIVDVPVPALLLDMDRIVPAEDGTENPATGQLAVTFEMSAYIIMGESVNKSNLLVRIYALGVAAILHQAKYGAPVGPAQVVDIVSIPGLHSADHAYIAWAVHFKQDALIGFVDDVCLDGDFGITKPPSEVFVGFDPKTGTEFEHVYERVVLNAESD